MSADFLTLATPDGAGTTLSVHGAQVLRWQPALGRERLFLSHGSRPGPGIACRGGVPVIFPRFATEPCEYAGMPRHGFARLLPWRIHESRGDSAVLTLSDSPETRIFWPCAFDATLGVQLAGNHLNLRLTVRNRDIRPMVFTAALHSYLQVADLANLRLAGLSGVAYRDSAHGGNVSTDMAETLIIAGEVDRIYLDTDRTLELTEPGRRLRITACGFADTVVWNPGPAKAALLADLEPDGWQRFLCVEAAAIARPVALAPNHEWTGTQTLEALA